MNDRLLTWEEAVSWLRQQPELEELIKSCFYDDPLLDAAKRYYHSTEWTEVSHYLKGYSGMALDIGAGRGIASYALARIGFRVVALEPDPSRLVGAGAIRSLADEENLSIIVEENWAEKLPFADATFDVVHARQVLHHARDLGKLCAESARVLKRNGLFIATREHVISRREDLKIFLDNHPLHNLYGGEHAYLLHEYIDSIKSAGFNISKVLNPMESNINLFPDTLMTARSRIAKRTHVPNFMIPEVALKIYGRLINIPGRLYSFVAVKKG